VSCIGAWFLKNCLDQEQYISLSLSLSLVVLLCFFQHEQALCYFIYFSKRTERVSVVSRHVTNDAVADNVSEHIGIIMF